MLFHRPTCRTLSVVTLSLALILGSVPGLPAIAKYKSKTGEVNTLDPAVNYFNEALKKIKVLDVDGCIDSCLQAIYFARNNYHPPAYILLGNCYKLKFEDAKALEALQKGIMQNVGPAPDAHCDMAEILMRNNRDREAESEINRAITEFFGPAPRAHNLKGKLLEKKKNYADAAYQYEQALGDKPWWYADAWMNFAEVQMKMKEWSGSIAQWVAILARGKTLVGVDYERVWVNLGACQFAKGDHNGALESWQRCLDINKNNPRAHLMLGIMFDQEQHMSSAVGEYRAFLRSHPQESDPLTIAIKDRTTELEQLIKPQEAGPQAAKPTPYMRKEMEQQVSAQRQQEDLMKRAMENLETPGQGNSRPDSGF